MAAVAPATTTPAPATPSTEAAPAQPQANPALANSSLYVGDLDRDVAEAQLYEVFAQIGPVASIRVCRDAVTRRSLGYAYVNYNSGVDAGAAERALEQLNYAPLAGRPMRLMWSHRDPSYRKSGVGNIFIKNLDKSIDNKALHDTFSAFGNILSCKVALDAAGESKGYGFVHYEADEAARLAIAKVNGMLLEDKKVYVGPFLRRSERAAESGGRFTNVFVKNLDESVDDEALKAAFAAHGAVSSAVVMRGEDGASRGFGFVSFEEPEAAAAAVEALNGAPLAGKELFVGRAQKKAEREAMLRARFEDVRAERIARYQGMNLYVKNLPDDADDEFLRATFAPYGTITSAKVMVDAASGKPRGFGFVCYASPEEATRAVSELNNHMLRGKPVYVALAQRREVRRAQLEQQHAQRMVLGAPRGPLGGPAPGMPGMFPPGAGAPLYYGAPRGGMPAGPGGPMMSPYLMGAAGPGRGGMGGRGAPRGGPLPNGGPVGVQRGAPGAGGRGGRGAPFPGRGGYAAAAAAGGRGPRPRGPEAEEAGAGGALTAAALASAAPEEQKQLLGEGLFPLVARLQPDLAGKITGMLLEMDNSELVLLLENAEALADKVDEAVAVLRQHNAIPEGAEVREREPVAA
ncbi:RB47 [Auxenochlorella protothecoides x Auxenochlorella symbiontica]